MITPPHLAAAVSLIVVMLATTSYCDIHSHNQNVMLDREEFFLDPTAEVPGLYTKIEDMTMMVYKFKKASQQHGISKRLVFSEPYSGKWENGVVPYTISSSYNEEHREALIKAMSHWEEHTCVRFVERTFEVDYIELFAGAGCQSFIGRTGGRQGVSIAGGCFKDVGSILHEIGHALGFLHEHIRWDRDDYVSINYDNIGGGFRDQFQAVEDNPAYYDDLGLGYDYNSIMHYDHNEFGRDGATTITALDAGIPLGGAVELSLLDILKINRFYDCPAIPPPRSTVYIPSPAAPTPTVPPLPYPCGEVFDGRLEGVITSDRQPDQDCQWQIRIPVGHQVRFFVDSIDVAQSSDCSEDYIEIYHKLDCTGYMERKICRSNQYRLYYTVGNVGCVRYHSSSLIDDKLAGFRLSFVAEEINECLFSMCSHSCTNLVPGYVCSCPDGFFLSGDGHNCFDVNECAISNGEICEYECINLAKSYECRCPDGSLQEKGESCYEDLLVFSKIISIAAPPLSRTLNSPNWPETYPFNTDLEWVIVCPEEDQHIEIAFASLFWIGGMMPDCPKDWVRIVGSDGTVLNQYCHLTIPNTNTYPVNNLIVRFHSGPSHNPSRKGFNLTSTCISSETPTTPSEKPTTPIPTTPSEKPTTPIPTTPSEKPTTPSEKPTTPIPTTPSEKPTTPIPTTPSEQLTTPIPTTPSEQPTTPNEKPTTPSEQPTTEKPKIQCPDIPTSTLPSCGSLLTSDRENFSTPNWPTTYNVDEVCEWVIEIPDCTKKIEISFLNFSIAGRFPGCIVDRVFIQDGLDTGSKQHGPYCNVIPPAPFTTTSNVAKIILRAGRSHKPRRLGFFATYKVVDG